MPAYFVWKPDLSVFVETIDDQHKELFRRLDRFMASVLEGEGKHQVGQMLKFLTDYCVVHFGTEELHMQKHDYPHYAVHKKAHERLTNDVLSIDAQMEEGVTSQHVIGLINQLGEWVTDHIEKMDKALGAYLRSALKRAGTPSPTPPHLQPSAELAGEPSGGGGACGYLAACSTLFGRFRDPESGKFWRAHYCASSRCIDCERKKLLDGGTLGIDVPITLLPNGQHLQSLAYSM